MSEGRRAADGDRPAGGRYGTPLVIAVSAVLAASLIRHGAEGSRPPRPGAGEAVTAPGGNAAAVPAPHPPLPYSRPLRVRVPELRVDAPVTTVGDDGAGGIGVPPPTDRRLAGWYTGGPSPGEQGTAVIDGHVDTMAGPAVFYGLGALHRGDTVQVARADGRTAVFTVYGIEVFLKRAFPGERVYGGTGRPELRLVTCGGGFTRKAGYDSDVVVFADLTAVR